MTERITVSGLSATDNDLVNHLLAKLADRTPGNLIRERAYEMKTGVERVSAVLPPQYARLGFALGWVAKGVDGLTNRCNVRGFAWDGGSLDDLGLREWSDENRAMSEFSMARTSSAIHGPSFLVNTVGADGEPASLLHARSALDATGDYDRRTRSMRSLLSVVASDDRGPVAFVLYQPGVTTTCRKSDGVWRVTDRQDHPWGMPVEVMRYKPRERRPFGSSRISPAALSHQASALRVLARIEGHADVYAWPEFWLLGADEKVFGDASRMEVMLGRLKAIPDDDNAENPRAQVQRFDAASPKPHLEHMNMLAKLMAREFSLPDSSFALSDYANPTSADSYVEGRDDLIADAETAMDEWSVAIRRATRRGLAMQNGDPAVFDRLRSLSVQWRSPLHLSQAAEADAGMKRLSAVPWLAETRVGLEILGLTDDQIDRALAERGTQATPTATAGTVPQREIA